MASKRPIASYYGDSTRSVQHAERCKAAGHSASLEGAAQAAVRRLMRGQWRRADVYNGALHVATLTRAGKQITTSFWK